MHFDIATAMLVTSLLTFGVGASLAFAASRYPAPLRSAMRVWIGGLFLQAIALSALAALSTSPSATQGAPLIAAVVVTLNTTYALAYAEMGRALHLFTHQRHRGDLPAFLVGAVAATSILLTFVWPRGDLRIAIVTVPIVWLQFELARSILRQPHARRPADLLTGALFLACVALTLIRTVLIVAPGFVAPEQRSMLLNFILVFIATLPMIGTIGFMLMCGDRLGDDLARLAMIDPLTGICNRRTFVELAEKAIGEAKRLRSAFSLLVIDLDHFKRINDGYGHETGDEALCRAVALMRGALGDAPVLSRIGGEEFAVLLPGQDEAAAFLVAERLRQHVATAAVSINGHALSLRLSVGVAALDQTASDLSELLRVADAALYAAKNAGRDRTMTKSDLVRAKPPTPALGPARA